MVCAPELIDTHFAHFAVTVFVTFDVVDFVLQVLSRQAFNINCCTVPNDILERVDSVGDEILFW